MMTRGLKILAITLGIPRPDAYAGDRRFCALLEILAKSDSVDLFYWVLQAPSEADERTYSRLCDRLGVGGYHGQIPELTDLLLRRTYDAGLVEFWSSFEGVGWLFRWQQPWAAMIVDSVDVHFLREEAALALGIGDPSTVAANREKELEAYRAADAIVVITEEDRVALVSHGVKGRLFQIPIIVPIRSRPCISREKELLFIGGFGHAPNPDGLLWFVREVWPGVKADVPDARLTVVGSNPTTEVLALAAIEGIDIVGYVPETTPYLDRAAVSIAPLRYGGGMKGKVCEAMASGLPVVTTTFGAQGLRATTGKHLILADDPASFGLGVMKLLLDPKMAERVGLNGQKLIATLCEPEWIRKSVDELTEWVASRPMSKLPQAKWFIRSLRHRTQFATRKLIEMTRFEEGKGK